MAYIQSHKHAPDQQPRFKRSAAFTALALAVPGVALAQQEQTLSTVSVTAEADSFKTDAVSSTKYTAPLVDTPKTVTVITQEVLQQTNATSLQEALRTTPGITFGMGEGGNPAGDNVYIRGFNAQTNTYIDGLRDPGSQSRNMFAVEAVEVTKGADSAYSGAAAVGGSINLVSKSARLGNFGEVSAGLGTDKYVRGTADINRQISDTAAVRLSLLKEKGDVPGRNAVDYDHLGANISAAFGLGTATRVTAGLYHYETDDMPDYGIPYNNPYTSGANTQYNGDGGPLNVNRNNFYGLKGRDFRKTNVDSASVKVEHDLNDKWTIRNATRYTKSLNDYIVSNPGDSSGLNITPGNITVGTGGATTTVPSGFLNRNQKNRHSVTESIVNDTQLSGEFFTGTIKHNVTVGVEFTRTETDSRGYSVTGANINGVQFGGAPFANVANPNPNDPWNGTISRATSGSIITTNTSGIYAFDTLTLNKQWLLNLGLRHDSFRSFVDYYTTNGAAPSADLGTKSSFNSYQAGVVFKPRENGSVYLNFASAANPSGATMGDGVGDNLSGTNAANLSIKDLEPEKVKSVELGTKWNLLGNKLALTAALFDIEKTNAKVQVDASTYATVGKQKTTGYELGFAGALTDKWSVFGGYTHINSELVEVGPLAANQASKGKQFPNTPEDSFSLWTSYRVLPKLTIGGGAYYVSKVFGNTANTKWVPDYWRYDAMATYQVDKNLSLRLNIQNLTDETYYDKAYTTHMVGVAPGRQATLTANYKF
jgi:catecholate siderophore receptor